MAEYIRRDVVKDELNAWAINIKNPKYFIREDAMHVLDVIPAENVMPIIHGQWIPQECGTLCSVCHREFDKDFEVSRRMCESFKICPECGARMDGNL